MVIVSKCSFSVKFGHDFSHRFPPQFNLVGVVDETVQGGIGDSRVSDSFMPLAYRNLTYDKGGNRLVAVLQGVEKVTGLFKFDRCKPPIVKDQEMRFL